MSRSSVRDGQEVYRVVVRKKEKIRNPEYVRGVSSPGVRYWIAGEEEYETSYGPYSKIGSARGVEVHEAYIARWVNGKYDHRAERPFDVVDSWIEKAVKIEWERI